MHVIFTPRFFIYFLFYLPRSLSIQGTKIVWNFSFHSSVRLDVTWRSAKFYASFSFSLNFIPKMEYDIKLDLIRFGAIYDI